MIGFIFEFLDSYYIEVIANYFVNIAQKKLHIYIGLGKRNPLFWEW